MAAHTPGPWSADVDGEGILAIDFGKDFTTFGRFLVFPGDMEVLEGPDLATADLMATAPELLEAAKTLLDVMLDRDGRGYDPATKARDEARLRDAVLGMAAAVDKAEGREHVRGRDV